MLLINKVLPTKIFIISLATILIVALTCLTGLYLFVNADYQPVSPFLSRPVTVEPISLTLNLSSPDDNLLTFDGDLLIQGKTTPKSTILLTTDEDNKVIDVDIQGNFSTVLELLSGLNKFTIISFDDRGNIKSENRTIFYSPDKL